VHQVDPDREPDYGDKDGETGLRVKGDRVRFFALLQVHEVDEPDNRDEEHNNGDQKFDDRPHLRENDDVEAQFNAMYHEYRETGDIKVPNMHSYSPPFHGALGATGKPYPQQARIADITGKTLRGVPPPRPSQNNVCMMDEPCGHTPHQERIADGTGRTSGGPRPEQKQRVDDGRMVARGQRRSGCFPMPGNASHMHRMHATAM
jgi:hypothetical protein